MANSYVDGRGVKELLTQQVETATLRKKGLSARLAFNWCISFLGLP